jgi:hypothetical protein
MVKYAYKSVFYFSDVYIIRIFTSLFLAFCTAFSQDTGYISHSIEFQNLITSQKTAHYKQFDYSIIPRFRINDTINGGVYAVIQDLIIGKHQSITILPNTVLLFEAGKRLVVNGELTVKGDDIAPVVFSNIPKEHSYIPVVKEDSLWNGVKVGENGRIDLLHTILKNSTSGIIASLTRDSVALRDIDFINVGQPHLKIGKNKSLLITSVQSEPELQPLSSSYSRNIKTARIFTGVFFGLFFTGSIGSAILSNFYFDQASKETARKEKADEYEKLCNATLTSSVVFGSLALASAFGFSFTFILNSKEAISK